MIPHSFFTTMVWVWTGVAVVLFPVMLFITAPYGRHSKASWGPMIGNRLGWFVMEFPALLFFVLLILMGAGLPEAPVLVFFLLWIAHYFHRSVLFPFRIKTRGKKMPLVIAGFAFFFNLVNGWMNGYWFGYLSPAYPSSWMADPRFIGGLALFVLGFIVNQYHDRILIRLRVPGRNDYVIPEGGLFRYISCPNFLGEIIEWGGFALMAWCLPAFSFFVWTMANLVPRALDHHRWYKSRFSEYPQNRKAIIPGIL